MINANTTYIGRKLGLRYGINRQKKKKEPWRKRVVKQSIDEIRKHINILEEKVRGEKMKRMKSSEIN